MYIKCEQLSCTNHANIDSIRAMWYYPQFLWHEHVFRMTRTCVRGIRWSPVISPQVRNAAHKGFFSVHLNKLSKTVESPGFWDDHVTSLWCKSSIQDLRSSRVICDNGRHFAENMFNLNFTTILAGVLAFTHYQGVFTTALKTVTSMTNKICMMLYINIYLIKHIIMHLCATHTKYADMAYKWWQTSMLFLWNFIENIFALLADMIRIGTISFFTHYISTPGLTICRTGNIFCSWYAKSVSLDI